ncbi:hypothetical protein Ae168Ps1_3376c [Pseudonocardia sp. Ae168_Ps1]|nr:hypothetical protein Ae168Ps1_3376c [Pseudonocardia sp. Ae168_Ps1]
MHRLRGGRRALPERIAPPGAAQATERRPARPG